MVCAIQNILILTRIKETSWDMQLLLWYCKNEILFLKSLRASNKALLNTKLLVFGLYITAVLHKNYTKTLLGMWVVE